MGVNAWQEGAGAAGPDGGAVPPALAEVRAVLARSGALDADIDALADEDDLYAAGLTSHGAVTLMLALEDSFAVEFPETLLRRRTFESVAAIHAAVCGLCAGTGTGTGTGTGMGGRP